MYVNIKRYLPVISMHMFFLMSWLIYIDIMINFNILIFTMYPTRQVFKTVLIVINIYFFILQKSFSNTNSCQIVV